MERPEHVVRRSCLQCERHTSGVRRPLLRIKRFAPRSLSSGSRAREHRADLSRQHGLSRHHGRSDRPVVSPCSGTVRTSKCRSRFSRWQSRWPERQERLERLERPTANGRRARRTRLLRQAPRSLRRSRRVCSRKQPICAPWPPIDLLAVAHSRLATQLSRKGTIVFCRLRSHAR